MSRGDWTLATADAAGQPDLGRHRAPKYRDRPSMRPYLRVATEFEDRLDPRAHDDVDPEWALLVFRRHLHARRFMKEASITTDVAHLALQAIPARRASEATAPRTAATRRADPIAVGCGSAEGDTTGANLKRVAAERTAAVPRSPTRSRRLRVSSCGYSPTPLDMRPIELAHGDLDI